MRRESPDAPIPLRVGYWAQPEFQDARFTGGGLDAVEYVPTVRRGIMTPPSRLAPFIAWPVTGY